MSKELDVIAYPQEKYQPQNIGETKLTTDQLAEKIYDYISSRRNFIRANGATYRSKENDAIYLAKIKRCIEKNKPIEIFFLSFCPKYKNEDITNGQIYPDMANLVSFTHLLNISKNLSEIYKPGIQFIVGLETDVYKAFGKHSQEEIDKTNEILQQLLEHAEEITQTQGQTRVKLLNVMDLVEHAGPRLSQAIKQEIERVTEAYNSGEIKEDMDQWIEFYKTTVSSDMFTSEVEKDAYALKQAIFYRAFNNVKYLNGQGITKDFPDAINATVRGTKLKATLKLIPDEAHFPHHGVCVLGKDKAWHVSKYSDFSQSGSYYIPRYFKDYPYPFYYEAVVPELPEHELNSLDCYTQFIEMTDGEKIVLKFSHTNNEDGTQILAKEISRIEEMKNAGIKLVPDVLFSQINPENTAYAMPLIEGRTLQDILLNQNLSNDEFKTIFTSFLDTINQQMYSKGITEKPENYIEAQHGARIDDIITFDAIGATSINHKRCLSPKEIAKYLKDHFSDIEQNITSPFIPSYTHGDLHFRNIIFNEKNGEFKTIDVNGRRPINTIETEMSRLLLSFDAYIIRNNLIKSSIDDVGNINIKYSPEAKRILALKEEALMLILQNTEINKWFKDIKTSEAQIRLLEAIHVLGVHQKRKDAEQLNTYAFGTALFNQAHQMITDIQEHPLIKTANIEDHLANMLQDLNKNPEDTQLYKKIMLRCTQYLDDKYNDFAFVNFQGSWFFRLTDKNGNKTVVGLKEPNLNIQNIKSSPKTKTYDDETFMNYWQKINFPDNSSAEITPNYSEKLLWESLFSRKPIKIDGKEYVIKDILGIGKESKAFSTIDGKVVKVGLQLLKKEYNYAEELAKTPFKSSFPEYYGYAPKENFIVMEQINGKTAEQSLREAQTPLEKTIVIRQIYTAICQACALYNQHGLYAGQFNLRNIMIDHNKVKIIDPFFEGTDEMYQLKQVCRMNAVLPQKLYNLDPEQYPLGVKGAHSSKDIKELRYPKSALDLMDKSTAELPHRLEQEIKQMFHKYLDGDIARFDLKDMEDDATKTMALATILEHKMTSSKLGIVFDINGTIEHNGQYSTETVKTINALIERGVPVAFITGKRYASAKEILENMGIHYQQATVYAQNGASCYQKDKLVYQEILSEKSKQEILTLLSDRKSDLIRTDESRVNILLSDISATNEIKRRFQQIKDVEIIVCKDGQEIEFLNKGINKLFALEHFAQQNNLETSHIIRIGNEPHGNDAAILKGQNAIIIHSPSQIDQTFKGISAALTNGALQISKQINLSETFSLKDFEFVSTEAIQVLSKHAEKTAQTFYPAFAIKARLDEHDAKRLDYKWVICDKEKPIGFTFIYELKDHPGKYNMGMYISPDYVHKGLGQKIMNKVFDFAQENIDNFNGLRVRVADINVPSTKLVERCGFKKVDTIADDYTLFDENGKEFKTATNVYEKTKENSSPQPQQIPYKIYLQQTSPADITTSDADKIVINFSGAANILTLASHETLQQDARVSTEKTLNLFGLQDKRTFCISTYYANEDMELVKALRQDKVPDYVKDCYARLFHPMIFDKNKKIKTPDEMLSTFNKVIIRGHCMGGVFLPMMEKLLAQDLENNGYSPKIIKEMLEKITVYMSSTPIGLEYYPQYFKGVALINAADSMLHGPSFMNDEEYNNLLQNAKLQPKEIADYSSDDAKKWRIPESKIVTFKKNKIKVHVANQSDLSFLEPAMSRDKALETFIESRFKAHKGSAEYEYRFNTIQSGHGTTFLLSEMRTSALNTFRNIINNVHFNIKSNSKNRD